MTKLELIKENSKLKYGIISLIENIKDIKEYRDLKKYLIELVDGKEKQEPNFERFLNEIENEK